MYQGLERETGSTPGYPTNTTKDTHDMWAYTDEEQDWLSRPNSRKHKRVSNQTQDGSAPRGTQHRNRIYERVTFDGKEYDLPMMI